MIAIELIQYLSNADAKFSICGNELNIQVDKSVMTQCVIENIKTCKPEILEYLKAANEDKKTAEIQTPGDNAAIENGFEQVANHEQADVMIDSLNHGDDRSYVLTELKAVFGSDRLSIMQDYLNQWQAGCDTEPASHKKENAGRYRANVWLRNRNK